MRPSAWSGTRGRVAAVAVAAIAFVAILIVPHGSTTPSVTDVCGPDATQPAAPAVDVSDRDVATGLGPTGDASALVLFDTTGEYRFLGELYATKTVNLVSHFAQWTAEPVEAYTSGQLAEFDAVIYVGSTYGEPLPPAFLRDVASTNTPVLWIADNLWQLVDHLGRHAFDARYGFLPTDQATTDSPATIVRYRGQDLTRDPRNGPLVVSTVRPGGPATVLATAVRDGGGTVPWALRGHNLFYIAEMPFNYVTDTDRILAFDDILFDVFGADVPTRHRAMLRLEDINPQTPPSDVCRIGKLLAAEGVPFGFDIIPVYVTPGQDPVMLKDRPKLIAALRYLESVGGVPVQHGYTHQVGTLDNPYNGTTADDYEFYRVTQTGPGDYDFVGPVPQDEDPRWAIDRIAQGKKDLNALGFDPILYEMPHYTASARDYRAIGHSYRFRWARTFYPSGLLTGQPPNYTPDHTIFQQFPYAVRDVYGTIVIPEDLGQISPKSFHGNATRTVQGVLAAARANLVVRDGIAGSFFNPAAVGPEPLKAQIDGMRALGYTFVDPASVATQAAARIAATPQA